MFKTWQDLNNDFITNLLPSFTVTEFKNQSPFGITGNNIHCVPKKTGPPNSLR